MILSLVTDASVEPVTLAEMKTFMKVDLTDEEDLITSLIVSARKALEDYAGIGMITKVYDFYFDEFTDRIKIPLPPCQSVDAFVYNSLSYSETAVPSASYQEFIYTGIRKSEVVKLPNATYNFETPEINAGRIRFTNGYGDAASDVPDLLKTAIKLTVSHWFENRESQRIPPEALRIMQHFKVYNL